MQLTRDTNRKNRWAASLTNNEERTNVQQNREFVKLPFSRFTPRAASAA